MAWISEYECECGCRHRVRVNQEDAPELRIIEFDCPAQRQRIATLSSGFWYHGGETGDAVDAMIRA
jgi:hypothetical protein